MLLTIGREIYSLQIRHESLEHHPIFHLTTSDAMTQAILTDMGGYRQWTGTAYKSKLDAWDAREGERLAFERVVQLAFRSRRDRADAWHQYLSGGTIVSWFEVDTETDPTHATPAN